ncbi:hypothetical protein EBB59_12245 [Lysobacter pythonis]|uniref:Lipoprotein n=1 Tax=Solilutibacter pythonis TaxID=2483112 RepID=A0A3M2HQ73_9GAMM|nr:hypothetical protein [Lysobacter pythonis]RMH87904.1 hypothetical protein EBB59_12245 [Lysobacter pythonis]
MSRRAPLALVALALALAACGQGEDPAVAAARLAEARETAAAPAKKTLDEAIGAERWELAYAQADLLKRDHAGTRAATEAAARFAEIEGKAKAARAERRLKALWDYQDNSAGQGRQLTAAIDARERIEIDNGRSPVKLIFRDHPEWGRSSYLVLTRGDFDCYRGCALKLTVDGRPRTLRGTRPRTDEAIAMFVTDHRTLWRLFKSARQVTIEFPVKPGGRRSATFETGGLDPARMPGWN